MAVFVYSRGDNSIDRFHVTSTISGRPYWCTTFNCVMNANTTQNYNSSLVFDKDASECEQNSEKKAWFIEKAALPADKNKYK